MKYATWIIKRPEGTTPEDVIRSRSGQASGGLFVGNETILGYVWNDVDLTGLEKWNFAEKTQTQALTLAKASNPKCFVSDDGTIQAPLPELA